MVTTKPAGAATVRQRRRRSDAERSITAILDAASSYLSSNPEASMAAIARAAGVGRVTLYAHFPSRAALVDAVAVRQISDANTLLEAEVAAGGPAQEILTRLAHSSWRILNRHRGVFTAALHDLSPQRLREHHDQVLDRVANLIARGQHEGSVRTDLPRDWIVATFYSLMHSAAEEVDAGRLDESAAGDVVVATLLGAFAPQGTRPAEQSPRPSHGRPVGSSASPAFW